MDNGNIFSVNLSPGGTSIINMPLGIIPKTQACIFKDKSEKPFSLAFEESQYYFEGQRRTHILAGLDGQSPPC